MEAPKGTESQESMLEALRLEYETQVEEFRSRLKLLSDQTRKQYQKSTDTLLELGSIEKLLAQLRLDVKAASDDEKYERAAELNMEIDSNLERAETVRRSLEESQDETRKLELQKASILKEFVNAQSTLLFRLSEVKSVQIKVVSHSRDHLSSLKSEAVTVYASKIEMLEERISDVQSELERIVDREQKLEAKITANCQGISETVKEDSDLVMSLEEEIKDLREKLAAKETLLNTVQTRLKSNQSKIDVLRKEHGNYLDEVVSDKSKKLESLAALRSEKSQLDAQIAQQHQLIEKQEASMEQEIKVMSSIDEETTSVEDRISRATQTATLFSISIEDVIKEALDVVGNSDSAESTGVAKSGTESSSTSTASIRGSAILSSIKQKVSDQRSSISKTEVEISSHKQELKRLKIEQDESRKSVPLLEQSKQVAVSAKDYKEAARLKSEISSVQASIENQTVEMDRITEALQSDQESLISQQATLTDLLTQLDVAESQQASGRLEELSKLIWTAKTEQRRLATISTSRPPESPLHNEALEISQTQLAGFLEVARGESAYLAMKFGLEIPSETPLEVPEPLTDTTHPQPTENTSSSEIAETIPEKALTPDPQTTAPEEDGGLFDGLDEASDNTEEKASESKVNESKDEEATQFQKSEDKQSEGEILLLEARIQATEDSLAEAEADEDYERAEELHQQVVSLKLALSGLTAAGTDD
jgi:chromosome segregation ATPase